MTKTTQPDADRAEDESTQQSSTRREPGDGPDAPAETTASAPPEIDGLPVLGSTVSVVRDGLGFAERVFERGDVVAYDAFGERFVAVADPDVVESVLVSRNDEFVKGEWETTFGQLVAPEGLAFTEGEQWRRQRTALQGSFTPAKVQSFADAVVDRATALAADWADADEVALRDDASRFTLDVLAHTLLDVDLDGPRGDVVIDAVDAIADYTSPLAIAVPEWLPLPAERRYRRAMADLDDLVATLVAERRGASASGEAPADEDRADLLATMLEAVENDDGLREDELRDQLVTFLGAGHETTATALTYAIWLVAGDPGVRERLDAELDAVLDGRDPGFADVPALEYTEAIVEEALRLYPPVYSIYREPVAATTVGGYRVTPDDTLQLSTYDVHRDPRWWDSPTEFRPERWLDDDESDPETDDDRPEYAFFPFGGGPRHCIGMRFARMELRLALATLANRLEFEQLGGIDPRARITLDPGDVRIRAGPRR